ncbi:hypothetical protein FUAX_19410 [Fulvitalea axinellae]|uniref:6-bladed beta-propeller n=1 Tax=Fulvitalea axinellae TaxID=1182444 RepID=A0AAU9CBL2_9BACT|nr:hypothetical protein FUAX_19410 [Fulvitalea axinellae]
MRLSILFLILCLFSACSTHHESNKLGTIDFEQGLHEKNHFDLKDRVTGIKYIPFETKEECMLSDIRNIFKVQDNYVVQDTEYVYMFDPSGHFIRKVSTKGKGPGEYELLVDVQCSQNEIFLVSLGKILVFSATGDYTRTIPLDDLRLQAMSIDNEGNFYFIMPDKTQKKEITSIDLIHIYDKEGHFIRKVESKVVRHEAGLAYYNNIMNIDGVGVAYKELFGNVIYSINKNTEPDSLFVLSLNDSFFKKADFNRSKRHIWGDKYLLLDVFNTPKTNIFKLQKGLIKPTHEYLVFDKEKDKIHRPLFDENKLGLSCDGIKMHPVNQTGKTLLFTVDPEYLEALTEKNPNIKLEEDCNPVLAVLTFK